MLDCVAASAFVMLAAMTVVADDQRPNCYGAGDEDACAGAAVAGITEPEPVGAGAGATVAGEPLGEGVGVAEWEGLAEPVGDGDEDGEDDAGGDEDGPGEDGLGDDGAGVEVGVGVVAGV